MRRACTAFALGGCGDARGEVFVFLRLVVVDCGFFVPGLFCLNILLLIVSLLLPLVSLSLCTILRRLSLSLCRRRSLPLCTRSSPLRCTLIAPGTLISRTS